MAENAPKMSEANRRGPSSEARSEKGEMRRVRAGAVKRGMPRGRAAHSTARMARGIFLGKED